MSFKYYATKTGEDRWTLPKTGSMKVDAVAFLSDALYESSEEEMWRQLSVAASYEGVTAAYAMPDCHMGFGVPIGCVIVTDNVVIQAASGYDISCGVIYLKTNLTAEDVGDYQKREQWVVEVEKRIATGIGSSRPDLMPAFSHKEAQNILRHGAKALGISSELCERHYTPVPDNIDLTKIEKAYEKVVPQLGSVGGGNHFVEMQIDRDSGEVFVMIHCGSRGYGHRTADHFFHEGAQLRGLADNRREESWLYIDEPLGKEYWAYHNSAANFAIANRHIITHGVIQALQEIFKSATAEVYYEISHNLVQEETLVLPDGTIKRGFVHRKGATRAFPAGHPDLAKTRWAATGHPCLIPGSMYHGAAILFAEQGAHASACSVNHGSGRIMARGRARRELLSQQGYINEEMRNVERIFAGVKVTGIVTNTEDVVLDECAHVYKDLDLVLQTLETAGIAKVAHRLFPVANIKGAD
ncbi:MAG: RtcB family protein [Lentisphaeria bacterium]